MKKLILTLKYLSYAIIVIGLIHLVATVEVLQIFKNLKGDKLSVFLYMYLMVGVQTVFMGIIIRCIVANVTCMERKDKRLLFLCSLYLCILGVGAVIAMPTNPFSYVMLVVGLLVAFFVVKVKTDMTASLQVN